ncbi:MAG: hypothetical protein JSV01_03595 [Desulfobacterales bacterium]|nr:MAG: hypothetical protein JSV01_03595 [Desulfobacterales bacterium]UCG81150.1 MAG: hypothetical protein JSV60_02380 [Desulfobacterales bacterium]
METFFVALVQLIFVAVVYSAAYVSGYNAAHDKAVSTIREFSGPVHDLLHRLDETMYETGEAEGEDWDDPA